MSKDKEIISAKKLHKVSKQALFKSMNDTTRDFVEEKLLGAAASGEFFTSFNEEELGKWFEPVNDYLKERGYGVDMDDPIATGFKPNGLKIQRHLRVWWYS